jgi:transcriptional regulator with XRE-family HTH domain
VPTPHQTPRWAAFLRERRLAQHIHDYEVATRTGISPASLRRLEAGRTIFLPAPATIAALGKALVFDPHDFCDALEQDIAAAVGRGDA